jgi:protein SCO1/2
MNLALKKTVLLFFVVLAFVIATFSLSVWIHKDTIERVQFSLINQDQKTVTNEHLAGRHLVVFFGYTSCPDICPTQVTKLDQAIKLLHQQGKANAVVPVFISVDPERDSQQILKAYLSYFHPSFVGLTGSRVQLKRATDSFHTLLQDAPGPGDENYLVAHSSLFYVVDQFGRVVENIPFNASVNEIVEKIKELI